MASLAWGKAQDIGNVGLVYISKCRRFMIVRRADKNYTLSYWTAQSKHTRVGDYLGLTKAKAAATEINDIMEP